jgi:glycosyltransferase involved in cell wall biosynthesis
MRILIVATQVKVPDSHGGSTHVLELIRHLREHHEVLALVRRGSSEKDTVGVAGRLSGPRWIRPLRSRLQFPRALKLARDFRPEVVYERASSYGLGALLSGRLGKPLVCMVLDEHYARRSLMAASRIVATDLDRIPPGFRRKGERVSWGANERVFRPGLDGAAARKKLGIEPEVPIVAFSGSFKVWHGLDVLVDAAALRVDGPESYLLIGDGPLRAQIESRVHDAGLGRRFVFTGAVPYDDVPRLLSCASVCISPFDPAHKPDAGHDFKGDPLKVFEYMAMRMPVIAADSPNLRALFEDGRDLVLVEPASASALADAISEMLARPDDAERLALSGHKLVLDRHTWAAHAAHLTSIFREVSDSS